MTKQSSSLNVPVFAATAMFTLVATGTMSHGPICYRGHLISYHVHAKTSRRN